MKARSVLTVLAIAIAATPVASAAPDVLDLLDDATHFDCNSEPPVWYKTCQPIADCVNGIFSGKPCRRPT